MIDIMSLWQSYERREFSEVRWIKGNDHPADRITKSNCNAALRNIIETSEVVVGRPGWVERG